MNPTYQIIDWQRHFENHKSRLIDKCQWVPVPNKQHGMGLLRILREKDGASIYGIWHLMVGACSTQIRPRDGWLTDDGTESGAPWSATDLAERWRREPKEIQRAFDILSDSKVGWIRKIEPKGHLEGTWKALEGHPEGTPKALEGHLEGTWKATNEGMKEGRKERKKECVVSFSKFWAEWPVSQRKVNRKKCEGIWQKEKLDAIADQIIASVKMHKSSPDWTKDNGQFIPQPATWLNQQRWEAPLAAIAAAQPELEFDDMGPVSDEEWAFWRGEVKDDDGSKGPDQSGPDGTGASAA